jgi:hypothetical protein
MYPTSHSQSGSLTGVNGKMDSTQTVKGDWSGIWMATTPIKTLVLGCTGEVQEGGIACHGLHAMLFQAETYVIKVCVMENMEKGYTGWNMYVLSDGQPAIKALDSF